MAKNKNSGKTTQAVPTQFDPAEEVEKMAKPLIAKYHTHLVNCKVAYLFKNKPMKNKGRDVVATAEKISAKHKALSNYDFLITVAYPTWKELSEPIRIAVLDHELTHCWVEDDEKTGEPKHSITPHDVEEFGSVILKHGLYTLDLIKLGNVVHEAMDNLPKDVVVKKLGDPDGKVAQAAAEKPKLKSKTKHSDDMKPVKSLKIKKTIDEDDEEEDPPKKKSLKIKKSKDADDIPHKKKKKKLKTKLEEGEDAGSELFDGQLPSPKGDGLLK